MRPLIFYGAGEESNKNIKKWKENGLIPACFADADTSKHFTLFCDKYEILPLDKAIERYPDYELYITLGYEKLRAVTESLLKRGISKECIRYAAPLEYRYGCDLLGKYLQFRANHFYVCCNQDWRATIARQETVRQDINSAINFCKSLISDFRLGDTAKCCNCPELREDIWEIEPEISCIQLATGFDEARCNLECGYCADKGDLRNHSRNNQHTVIETFNQLIELYPDNNVEIQLAVGEIGVSPYRDEILGIAEKHNRRIQIFTNATVYIAQIASLMKGDFARLIVSVDAGTPETYHRIKGVDCFEKIISNLTKYAETKGQIALKYIIVDGINDNEKDIDGFVDLVMKLNAIVLLSGNSLETSKRMSKSSLEMLLRLIGKIKNTQLIFPLRENFNPRDLCAIDEAIQKI
jgi:sulfatase maturation enzyme AslB (radical SAM superfamily)